MAYENNTLPAITVEASGDLSTKQYFFGTINSSGQVAVTGAAAAADGVICNKPSAAGQGTTLVVNPGAVVKVIAGAAVARGALVEADASGRAVTLASGKVLAKVLQAATAAGQLVPALLVLQR